MRTLITAAVLLMLCAGATAQAQQGSWAAPVAPQTLTECGRSDGYAYYFTGGLSLLAKAAGRRMGSMAVE
jgi:hypothetical protein